MLLQLVQNLYFCLVFNVNNNVIELHNNRNVKLLCQDFIDVALKYGQSIGQTEKHYLVLGVAVLSFEVCFSFVVFSNSHPIVSIG